MASLTAPATGRALPAAAAAGFALRPHSPSPSLFPTGLVEVRNASVEELEGASFGWDVRYGQLETGSCRCRLASVHTARLQIRHETWSLGMLKTGRVPRGTVTFLVPVGRNGSSRIDGRPVTAGEVVVLLDGDEFHYRSTGPHELVSVSLERTALEARVRALLGRHFGELRLEGKLSRLRTDHAALRALCRKLARRAANHVRQLRDPALAASLERRVVKLLLMGFENPQEPGPQSRGRTLARKAEAWLRQNLAEPPSIAALCAAVDASERTLHEAFREHLDTTPKAYLKALRLNAARHDLSRGEAKTRVTDVALDWGFVHFGWFSQDYRRLFGETPSQTLQRGRVERRRTPAQPRELPLLSARERPVFSAGEIR
jgi:AraC family transcriptional regulator, ethanolamine operon transcriptional activator